MSQPNSSLSDLIMALASSKGGSSGNSELVEALLIHGHKTLQEKNSFQPGDIVYWKDGMKNRKFPESGEPAIVVEVLSETLYSAEDETGSQYFREPLDIVLGIHRENTFLCYHYDSRRFRKK